MTFACILEPHLSCNESIWKNSTGPATEGLRSSQCTKLADI